VDCLGDIMKVVEESSVVNQAVLVGNEVGESFIPIYDWASFLSPHFHKFSKLLSQHHFRFVYAVISP
jgi:adenosyl cobinamide kinase/adenosyl cobinamide phosphate guanylyltransferase